MYIYTEKNKQSLVKALSEQRLSTYLKASNGDLEKALELYIKNIEISAAFLLPLQVLEVTIRNAMNEAISEYYTTKDWFDKIPLNNGAIKIIKNAQKTVQKNQTYPQVSHVIAELPFGFWLSMLNKEYHQTLWIPFFHKCFPFAHKPRSKIHSHLDHLRLFRNRIAHHEPIFSRHLEQDYKSILLALEWIEPEVGAWVRNNCKVQATL